MIGKSLAAVVSLSLATVTFPALAADSAAAVLKRASTTMGAPKTIRYSGESTDWAAAAGATVVVHQVSKAYFERAFATHSKVAPDLLTQSKRKAKVQAVNNRLILSDGSREVRIMNIVESNHAAGFMMMYLPKEKFLIEADAYTPIPPGAKPPATPNANNVNLVVNIEGFQLAVDKILPLHGRVVMLAAPYTSAGRTPPK